MTGRPDGRPLRDVIAPSNRNVFSISWDETGHFVTTRRRVLVVASSAARAIELATAAVLLHGQPFTCEQDNTVILVEGDPA